MASLERAPPGQQLYNNPAMFDFSLSSSPSLTSRLKLPSPDDDYSDFGHFEPDIFQSSERFQPERFQPERFQPISFQQHEGKGDYFLSERRLEEPIMTKTQARRQRAQMAAARMAAAENTGNRLSKLQSVRVPEGQVTLSSAEPEVAESEVAESEVEEPKVTFLSAAERYEIKKAAALKKESEEVDSDEKYIGALESLAPAIAAAKQALDDADADVAATWKKTNGRSTKELDEKQRLARRLKSEYLALQADAPLSSVRREIIRAAKAAAVPIVSSSQRYDKKAEKNDVTTGLSSTSTARYKQKEQNFLETQKQAEAEQARENARRADIKIAGDHTQELSSLLASSARVSTLPPRPQTSTPSSTATEPEQSGFFSKLFGLGRKKGGKNTHHHRKKSKSALSRKNSKRYSVKAKRRNRRKSRR